MRQNQTLPVPVKHVLTAICPKSQTAPRFSRLQKKVHLCIMAKRLKMPHTLCRPQNRFFVYDTSGSKLCLHAESLPDLAFQNLHLYLAHDLRLDFSGPLVPDNMEQRVLFLKHSQILKHPMRVTALRQQDPQALKVGHLIPLQCQNPAPVSYPPDR